MSHPPPARQCQLKIDEWLPKIVAMIKGQVDELALKRIEHETDKSLACARGDQGIIESVLHTKAMIAYARGRYKDTDTIFSSIQNPVWETVTNHQKAMVNCGRWRRAQQLVSQTIVRYPDHKEVLFTSLHLAIQIGDYWSAAELAERIENLNMASVKIINEEIVDWRNLARENGIGYAALMKRWALALNTVQRMGLTPTGTASSVAQDGSISLKFCCDGPMEKLVEADFAIADALVGSFDDTYSHLITFATLSSDGR